MTYSVKEIYLTVQGEGVQTGMPAVFLRFAGCNLWSGLESGRSAAVCKFCDTDFVGTDGPGGGKFKTPSDLVAALEKHWPKGRANKWIVATGGEPLLQLDAPLIGALHDAGFKIAVESNGTVAAPDDIDWLCISPKAGATVIQTSGHELKLVYPQPSAMPETFDHIQASHRYIQPMADASLDYIATDAHQGLSQTNTQKATNYCLKHPQWKLSLQTHKMLGIE